MESEYLVTIRKITSYSTVYVPPETCLEAYNRMRKISKPWHVLLLMCLILPSLPGGYMSSFIATSDWAHYKYGKYESKAADKIGFSTVCQCTQNDLGDKNIDTSNCCWSTSQVCGSEPLVPEPWYTNDTQKWRSSVCMLVHTDIAILVLQVTAFVIMFASAIMINIIVNHKKTWLRKASFIVPLIGLGLQIAAHIVWVCEIVANDLEWFDFAYKFGLGWSAGMGHFVSAILIFGMMFPFLWLCEYPQD